MLPGLQLNREILGRLDFTFMTLTIVEGKGMDLEILLFGDSCHGSRIDSAAQKNDCFLACHLLGSRNLGPLHWVTLLVPADDPLVENFHVPITVFIENAISQTGQVMRASSIKDYRPVTWDAFDIAFKLRQRSRSGAHDMSFLIFFCRPNVDNDRLFAG